MKTGSSLSNDIHAFLHCDSNYNIQGKYCRILALTAPVIGNADVTENLLQVPRMPGTYYLPNVAPVRRATERTDNWSVSHRLSILGDLTASITDTREGDEERAHFIQGSAEGRLSESLIWS